MLLVKELFNVSTLSDLTIHRLFCVSRIHVIKDIACL